MKVRKIINWKAAEDFFNSQMDDLYKTVRYHLLQSGKDTACWKVFQRVWRRKKEKGRREIRKALWKQTKTKRRGAVSTRNP
jgi:hypothetical protein